MRLSSYPQWFLLLLLSSSLLFVTSCNNDEDEPEKYVDAFYKEMQTLTIEVAYEPGAEPYDFNNNGANVWEFTEANIESLFVRRPIDLDVHVPAGLSQMTLIPDQNKNSFSAQDIVNLANRHRLDDGNNLSGNIFVLFLNGYFELDDTVRQNIMGVNIVGTSIVAVFKPMVINAHNLKIFREFIEQSTVIHELGHALGLVFNGVPVTSSHQDIPHGSHCTNTDCVMYWQNEHPNNLTAFVQAYYSENKPIIFGEECIRDVTAYFP